jgi:hypothetical protein
MKRLVFYGLAAVTVAVAAFVLVRSAVLIDTADRYSFSTPSAYPGARFASPLAQSGAARSPRPEQARARGEQGSSQDGDLLGSSPDKGALASAADGTSVREGSHGVLGPAGVEPSAGRAPAVGGDSDNAEGEDDPLSISGWVQEEDGQSVAGIDVFASARELVPSEGPRDSRASHELVSRTGGDGFFSFRDLADGLYELRTEETKRFSSARARLRAGEEAAVLVVAEDESLVTVVFGEVSTTAGEPIAGAQVMAVGQAAASATDESGAYELEVESEAGRGDVTFRFLHRGHRERRLVVPASELRDFEVLRLDSALGPIGELAQVTGRVTSPGGSPIAGATVLFSSNQLIHHHSAVTDRYGRFLMPEVEVGPGYRLWVQDRPEYRDHVREGVQVGTSGLELSVTLERLDEATLAGRMVDAQGRALPGVSLWLRSGFGSDRGRFITGDREGRFLVEDLPEGPVALDTRAAAPQLSVSGLQLAPGGIQEVEFVLDVGRHSLSGRVVGTDGEPVPGSELSLAWTISRNGLQSQSHRSTRADGEGRFLFAGLGPGEHTLDVRAPQHRSARLIPEVGADTSEVVVRLERTSR